MNYIEVLNAKQDLESACISLGFLSPFDALMILMTLLFFATLCYWFIVTARLTNKKYD